jgi:hypothetical protein
MNRNKKILATAAVFGAMAVAAGAGAFTATSTVDSNKLVGAASQTVSGVTVTNVTYDYTAATDKTNGVSFVIAETMTADETLTVSGVGDTTVTGSCADKTATPVVCTFTGGVVNLTTLSIVVN